MQQLINQVQQDTQSAHGGRCLVCMYPLASGNARQCRHCYSPVPYTNHDSTLLFPGSVLKGRYLIGRPLGSGGFGNTYLAYDQAGQMVCAIKEYYLRGAARRDRKSNLVLIEPGREIAFTRFRGSFLEEAKQLSLLGAIPGIVRIYDVFTQYNTAYFAMNYVQGPTLMRWIERQRTPLALQDVLRMIKDLLDILVKLHAKGLLHRDISMDNIIRGPKGELTLIDFGAARQAGKPEMTVYQKGVYTAPEQRIGAPQGPYTDIYSVGIILFALLHGRLPKEDQARLDPLPGLPEGINVQLGRVFRKATHPKSDARYQQASQMCQDLEQISMRAVNIRVYSSRSRCVLSGIFQRTPKESKHASGLSSAPWDGKKTWLKALLVLVVLTILALILFIVVFGSDSLEAAG